MTARHFEGIAHAALYAKFRPAAPTALIRRIINFLKEKHNEAFNSALDVGCGSGQSTVALSTHFSNVIGVDVSEAQVNEAKKKNSSPNISYRVSIAEKLPFEKASFQLVTAGQACHWFDLPKFYKEVERILTPNGVLALYGYNFPHPIFKEKNDDLYNMMNEIYVNDTKDFWGSERIYVDNAYTDERFKIPFKEGIRDDKFAYESKGSVMDLAGYISTWSGFQKYKELKGEKEGQALLNNFVERIMDYIDVNTEPENTVLTLRFPFFLILGRKGTI